MLTEEIKLLRDGWNSDKKKRKRKENLFRAPHRQASELRNFSVCWKCFRWESRFLIGWGVWEWPVVMTDHLSVPVPVSYTDQNLFRWEAYFHSRSLKIQGDERGSYIFLSNPSTAHFNSWSLLMIFIEQTNSPMVSPYFFQNPPGEPRSDLLPPLYSQKSCRASQPHLRNRKLWPYLFTSNWMGFIFSFPYPDPMLKHMCRHAHWQAEKQAGYSEPFM